MALKNGDWREKYPNSGRIIELKNLTVGIVGFGAVGELVCEKLSGFGCKILISNLFEPERTNPRINWDNVRYVELDELIAKSDIISLHARSKSKEPIFGKQEFKMMKKTAIFINTARSYMVDYKALYDALQKGAETSQELYTNATYTALLQAMQNGYDVFTDDSATDAEITAATQAINKAYDGLRYLNLRPMLENQIAALTPPAGSEAQYGRYTAKQTSSAVIPDGEYVISLDFNNRGTNGCWGVMSNTYVYEEEPDPRYADHRRDACCNRRVIPANNFCNTRGLLTIRRPIPNTNLILGGV